MTEDGRDTLGRFAEGNGYGQGRPRRAVESQYMRRLSDALSLEDWGAIVTKAIEDARQGDGKAREWVTRYALGAAPVSFAELAARDAAEIDADLEIEAEAQASQSRMSDSLFTLTVIDRAERILEDKAEAAERERRRQRRRELAEARKAQAAANGQGDGSQGEAAVSPW